MGTKAPANVGGKSHRRRHEWASEGPTAHLIEANDPVAAGDPGSGWKWEDRRHDVAIIPPGPCGRHRGAAAQLIEPHRSLCYRVCL